MRNSLWFLTLCSICFIFSCAEAPPAFPTDPYPVYISGEGTQTSMIVQARLQDNEEPVITETEDIAGLAGTGYFEYAPDTSFADAQRTDWLTASAENDFLFKTQLTNLQADQTYFYRLIAGQTEAITKPFLPAKFQTLPDTSSTAPFRFVASSCINFARFYGYIDIQGWEDTTVLTELQKEQGFPGLASIQEEEDIAFWVSNGDNVYYDQPREPDGIVADSIDEMRAKWHRQLSMLNLRNLTRQVPTYWLKDDHDHRYNDSDTTGTKLPLNDLGIAIFREQIPIVASADEPTYRTHRLNKHLQVWFLEGRDYRSPNDMPDGPEKSIWGAEQRAWLQNTLLESTADFKIIISPTPMIGPDDAYKNDNHTNPGGFQYERDEFFAFLEENGLVGEVFFITGDRHWQYHSIYPNGLEEFATGALVKRNARYGRPPGDPKSTDPDALITQPYLQPEPSGGYMIVETTGGEVPVLKFTVKSQDGDQLYATERTAKK